MEGRYAFLVASLLLVVLLSAVRGQQSHEYEGILGKPKVTHLRFYLHDVLSGNNPTAVMVARANRTARIGELSPFGSTYVIDDLLTEGPEPTSKAVGNAQGLYVSSDKERWSLVLSVDFGFTDGEFNGSSISVLSRNPILEAPREVAVVGGRGKFRFARGYAQLRSHFFNFTNGDTIIEYNVTVLHYETA